MSATRLPLRSEVPVEHTWDLASLFRSDAEWETAFASWEKQVDGYAQYRGKLGESAEVLAACLKFDSEFDRTGDRIGTYAMLRETEDVANSTYQGLKARYIGVATRAMEAASYLRPEILALPDATLAAYLTSRGLVEGEDFILAAPAHGDEELVFSGKVNRFNDICFVGTACDHGWMAVDHPIPYLAGLFVSLFSRTQNNALQLAFERLDGFFG